MRLRPATQSPNDSEGEVWTSPKKVGTRLKNTFSGGTLCSLAEPHLMTTPKEHISHNPIGTMLITLYYAINIIMEDGADAPKLTGKLITDRKATDAAKPDVGDGRLRGSLMRPKDSVAGRPDVKEVLQDGNFVVEKVLNVEHDEDGLPIARSLEVDRVRGLSGTLARKTKIGFVSVADGLGGAGSRHVMADIDGTRQERTMAYIAARKAQEAARNVVDANPQILTGTLDEVRESLELSIRDSFSTINAEEPPPSPLKSKLLKDYPTTFSSAVVQETEAGKRVMLFWTGDSPLFVFTPDRIYSTYTPGAGDAVMGEEAIHRDHYVLNAQQLDFPPDTPLLVVAASDGVLKLGAQEFELAKEFILEGVKNNPPDEIGEQLRASYQARKELGSIELDDTTIAIVGSMKPGETASLNSESPIQTIA